MSTVRASKFLLSFILSLTGLSSLAVGVGDGAGGLDAAKATQATLKYIIEGNGLKKAMLNYIKTLDITQIDTSDLKGQYVHSAFSRMLNGGALQNDILTNGNYYLGNDCKDAYSNSVPASAIIGQVGGKICFDIEKLSEEMKNLSPEEMMIQLSSIAFHEHVHHFQVTSRNDEDINKNEYEAYQVYAYVRITAKIVQDPLLKWTLPPSNDPWSKLLSELFAVQVYGKEKTWGCDKDGHYCNYPSQRDIEDLITDFHQRRKIWKKLFYEAKNNFPLRDNKFLSIADRADEEYGEGNALSQFYRMLSSPEHEMQHADTILVNNFVRARAVPYVPSKHPDIGEFYENKEFKWLYIDRILAEDSPIIDELRKIQKILKGSDNNTKKEKEYAAAIYNNNIFQLFGVLDVIRNTTLEYNSTSENWYTQTGGAISLNRWIRYEGCLQKDGDHQERIVSTLFPVGTYDTDITSEYYEIDPIKNLAFIQKILVGGPGYLPLKIICKEGPSDTERGTDISYDPQLNILTSLYKRERNWVQPDRFWTSYRGDIYKALGLKPR